MEQLFFPVTRREAERQGISFSSEKNKDAPFPVQLRKLREEKGISQAVLAKELGVSKSTVGLWETGDTLPDAKSVFDLANYYNVSSDWLLGLSEYRSKKNEQVSAKEIGLSEIAIRVLKELAFYPYARGVLRVINKLIEQERPAPSPHSFILSENDLCGLSKSDQEELKEKSHENYKQLCAVWDDTDYTPVISKIATFLFLRIDSKKRYWLNPDGSIAPRPSDANWYEDYGAVNTFQSKDIIDQMLFSQIEDELRKLRDKLQSDPEWGTDTPLVIHHGQAKED